MRGVPEQPSAVAENSRGTPLGSRVSTRPAPGPSTSLAPSTTSRPPRPRSPARGVGREGGREKGEGVGLAGAPARSDRRRRPSRALGHPLPHRLTIQGLGGVGDAGLKRRAPVYYLGSPFSACCRGDSLGTAWGGGRGPWSPAGYGVGRPCPSRCLPLQLLTSPDRKTKKYPHPPPHKG